MRTRISIGAGLPPLPMAPWSPPAAAPVAIPAKSAGVTPAAVPSRLAVASSATAAASHSAAAIASVRGDCGSRSQASPAAYGDGDGDEGNRAQAAAAEALAPAPAADSSYTTAAEAVRRASPVPRSLKVQATAAMQGAVAAAAAAAEEEGSDEFGSEGRNEPLIAAHSDVDCEVHGDSAPMSPAAGSHGCNIGSPQYPQRSSVWSSPAGNREVQGEAPAASGWQLQHANGAPLSPGLSLAELSTGAPIDLAGSEADSDLLESNRSEAWQPAPAAAAQPTLMEQIPPLQQQQQSCSS
ncbi:hypothetical protein COO60DRAFT_711349 [Scenedesmus sp. NREL 46B-D3]|nr:hypothetical protein COO60DRAFT_711349 [Scenedesmus sp. NREL 46B-D3]